MSHTARKLRVLVLDDEPIIRMVIRTALQRPGLDIIEAENGRAAREYLERNSVDVLLADKNLPDANGLDIVRFAKKHDARMGPSSSRASLLGSPQRTRLGLAWTTM